MAELPSRFVIDEHPRPPERFTVDDQKSADTMSGTVPVQKGAGTQLLETIENIPESAGRYVGDIAQTVMHPIDTGTTLANLGRGVMQKLGILQGTQYEIYPEAVGKMMADRYGSVGAALKSLHDDPVGVAADASMIFGGAGLAPRMLGMGAEVAGATRTAGALGKIADVLGAASKATDPVGAARKAGDFAARWGGEGVAQFMGRAITHTGEESVRTPAKAGYEAAGRSAFLKQVLGRGSSQEELVAEARAGLNAMRKARSAAYNSDKARVLLDKKPLDFKEIDKAIEVSDEISTFKGMTITKPDKVREYIRGLVARHKLRPPAEYHTAEGMDFFKKQLWAEVENKFGELNPKTPEYKVLKTIYDSVKDTIISHRPEYGKMMKAYEDANNLIEEMEKTLSLNSKATIDTAMRKLLSVLRDNVSTNYGHRRELVKYLMDAGATHILQKLAGEQMRTLFPRGLGGAFFAPATLGVGGAVAAHSPGAALTHGLAAAAGYATASSPAVVGLGALGAGTAARYAGKASHAAPHARMLGKIGARQAPDGGYYIQGEDGTHYRVEVDDPFSQPETQPAVAPPISE